MSINPVLMNATIQRVQDFSNMKQNVDEKSTVDQSMIQHAVQKHDEQKANQVLHKDNADMMSKKFNASEQGNGKYQGDGGKNRKKREKGLQSNGRVINKGGLGGFDMKV